MSDMCSWALYYRSQGLSIIPVKGKTPLVLWKEFQERCANEEEIKTWWTTWPNADIGMVTGPISQRLVLDVDGEIGAAAIKKFQIPTTKQVKTKRGFQLSFSWPSNCDYKTTVANIIPNITNPERSGEVDVRGQGGYVKLPPSQFSDGSGRYEWIGDMNTPLADAPQWLLDKLSEKPKFESGDTAPTREPWLEELLQGVGDGLRHQSLIKLGGYYFNHFPPEVALIHLREWNKKNTPPIDEYEFEEQLTDLKNRFINGEYKSNFKEKIPRKLDVISAETLVRDYSRAPQYLVQRLIPQGARTIFSGWQGRGKSFCMTDLVIEVARKKGQGKWMGLLPVQQGAVIYIDNENGKNLVSHRMTQLLGPKGLTTNDLNLHFVIGNHFKVTSESDYIWLKEQIQAIKPVLVVMDSLASCHALDENQSANMRYFFDDLIAPLCEEFGTGFLCIDHERKDTVGLESSGGKRLRGSSAKGDAVDCILSLNEKDGIVFMEHSKSRYSKRQQPLITTIEDVSNGIVVKAKEYSV